MAARSGTKEELFDPSVKSEEPPADWWVVKNDMSLWTEVEVQKYAKRDNTEQKGNADAEKIDLVMESSNIFSSVI